jgi:hypothetical protein
VQFPRPLSGKGQSIAGQSARPRLRRTVQPPPFVPQQGRIRRLWYGSESMAAAADLERLLERVFERTTARLFRARIQVLQVERKVERAMERARTPGDHRTLVPSRYRVRLDPDDLEGLATDVGGAEALAGRLADAALAFARAHGYHLAGRPSVALIADPSVGRGVVEVDAVADPRRPAPDAQARPTGSAQPPVRVPDMPVVAPRASPVPGASGPLPGVPPGATVVAAAPSILAPASDPTAPARDPGPAPERAQAPGAAVFDHPAATLEPDPVAAAGSGGIRGDGTQTLVFRRPAPQAARARLRVMASDGTERIIEVDATPLTLGRSKDNALVLADTRVSRHHGRLQTRRGTLVYTDLASTNGSRVNGVRVDECALGMGDRILVGDTVLLVEQLPG